MKTTHVGAGMVTIFIAIEGLRRFLNRKANQESRYWRLRKRWRRRHAR